MNDSEFDAALVGAALTLAAERGWRAVNPAAAAREAELDLVRARQRFPGNAMILLRLGVMADQAAIESASSDGPVRDRLFDMLMRRIDTFQLHRAGVLALLRELPRRPGMALMLAAATARSMRWLLQSAGIGTGGPRGAARVKAMVAIWLWTFRAWRRDESADLSRTMAALDESLRRAEEAVLWFRGQTGLKAEGRDTGGTVPEEAPDPFDMPDEGGGDTAPEPDEPFSGPRAVPGTGLPGEPPSEPPYPTGPAPLPPAA
jgi:ubiquinone biosynthesis protein COQ9